MSPTAEDVAEAAVAYRDAFHAYGEAAKEALQGNRRQDDAITGLLQAQNAARDNLFRAIASMESV